MKCQLLQQIKQDIRGKCYRHGISTLQKEIICQHVNSKHASTNNITYYNSMLPLLGVVQLSTAVFKH